MAEYAPYITLVLSIIILWHSVVSHWAIRGNELKHLKTGMKEMQDHLCKKIDNVTNRVERIENWIFKDKD